MLQKNGQKTAEELYEYPWPLRKPTRYKCLAALLTGVMVHIATVSDNPGDAYNIRNAIWGVVYLGEQATRGQHQALRQIELAYRANTRYEDMKNFKLDSIAEQVLLEYFSDDDPSFRDWIDGSDLA